MAAEQITQDITLPDEPPSSRDRVNFRPRADTFVAWMKTFATQTASLIPKINTALTWINTSVENVLTYSQTATTQAGIATNKASEASASAASALSSKEAAEAIFDSFDDKYLGAKAVAPTVDNDGEPLTTGALYFKTTAPKGIYVYDAELLTWSSPTYVPTSHGSLSGRSDNDAHPMSAVTGLIEALALKLSIAVSGLCSQTTITDDPNNATQEYILTKHANCPDANVSYWYIHTIFYTAQTNGAPRSQMAYAYTGSNAVYNRHYISGAWSAWTRVDKEAVDATSSVKGIDFKGLLAEFEVTGSPVTSINFSGLDINTHKSYRVEIDNVSNGASYIALFVNGDNTQTNYYTQQIFTTSATVSGTNSNASRFGYQAAEDNLATVSATIHKGANGLVTFESLCSCDRNESACFFGRKTGTVANVTQLTFTHALTNGFGVGSKIRIYRGDV